MADDAMGRSDALRSELPVPHDRLDGSDEMELSRLLECERERVDLERSRDIGQKDPSRPKDLSNVVDRLPGLGQIQDHAIIEAIIGAKKVRIIHVADPELMIRRPGRIENSDIAHRLFGMFGPPLYRQDASPGTNHPKEGDRQAPLPIPDSRTRWPGRISAQRRIRP